MEGTIGTETAEREIWHEQRRRIGLLTERECQVFLLLGAGYSNRSISTRLQVTEGTVKAHVAQILGKLRVESRLQAGLVSLTHQLFNKSPMVAGREVR
ncbi:response regulator transcription factor [Streptomyces roseoverticillatus]|uniref:response regulator transcription factor n=1 Tax=Streptomyces roseoverticillatus TaxID=66429 RepID=UPI0012FEF314|nr:LuxR C-terminal-related transcriptional regulator [Streptomyces roseoverticillatus]